MSSMFYEEKNTPLSYEEKRKIEDLEREKQLKKEKLVDLMKVGATVMVGVIALAAVAGMFRSKVLTEGNFGIEKHFTGSYNTAVLNQGFQANIFDSIYEVYGKESLIKIENVRPKDKSGIMLKDLDLNIVIKANKDNAVPFLLKTGDMVFDDTKKAFVLGEEYISKEARSVANQTIRKFESEQLIDQQSEVEETFKQDLQSQLNTLYGKDTFTVTDIKLANIQFSDSVEEKIQSIELIRAEESKANATEKILSIRNGMLNKEVKGLQEVAKNNNISFDQLLDYQKTKVLMEQKFMPQVTMPISSPKP